MLEKDDVQSDTPSRFSRLIKKISKLDTDKGDAVARAESLDKAYSELVKFIQAIPLKNPLHKLGKETLARANFFIKKK